MHSRLRPLLQYYSKSHMDGLRPAISGLGLHMDSLIMVLSIKESMVCTTVSDLQVRVEAHTQSEREKERQTDRQTDRERALVACFCTDVDLQWSHNAATASQPLPPVTYGCRGVAVA